MKKRFLFLLIVFGLTFVSSADYLDDWSDKDLCGWMDNPSPPVPIRPGWKIAEGSNFWSIDEADPYWQTDEGSAKLEAAKDRGSWIETEASRYAQENPCVDAPIPSYYATDSCGEGKQEPGASC